MPKYKDLILEIIKQSDVPLNFRDILLRLKDYGINKTTIYRNIDKLLVDCEIFESNDADNIKCYFGSHRHFINCSKCNKIISIDHEDMHMVEESLTKLEKKLQEHNKLKNITHQLKFITNCYDCTQ